MQLHETALGKLRPPAAAQHPSPPAAMSLITKGLDILSARLGLKRNRPVSKEAPAARRAASQCTAEQALDGLGRCSLHTGGSIESALKRSRVAKTDPGVGAGALDGVSGQAKLPFAAFDNPLFHDEEGDDSEVEDEFGLLGGCTGGSQLADEENTSWLGNINLPGASASPPLRRLHPAGAFGTQGRSLSSSGPSPVLGCSGSKTFAGIGSGSGGGSGSADLLAAFKREVQSPLVLSALCSLERYRLHPFGADGEEFFDSLEGTAAGVLVLCRRARIGSEELSPELLLTLLWIIESCESQYRNDLSACLKSYLRYHPGAHYLREGLSRRIVLERCNWRVLLRDRQELQAAMDELESDRSFPRLCDHIADCAEEGVLPLGSLPPAGSPQSPRAAAAVSHAVAAAQGCSLSGEVGCSSDGELSPLICASEAVAAGLGGGHWEHPVAAAGAVAGDGKCTVAPHIVTRAAVEGLRAPAAPVAR
ncbi:type 12 methyltransferase [Chlorella sorokiniana]|uniref:Type 12 methyltransferase n=1 Tax=Chlorella sorokiniana TaxID=3076 RepID=A0A2P6TL78_CHLSO|nr:type 12 methyltransferase [Chlorella sorokiniana]|eukprot:PRW45039.1 type 12 methyltransferase [Chlorella sorokiniana]